MSQTSSSETPVTKLARFIVDKRKAFFLVFLAAVLFCGSSIDKVVVNNDITSYLPAETETRRGLTLMDEEFTTYASAQVMLSNVTYRQAEKVAAQLAELDGVSSVAFDDSTDHFKDSSALFSVSFTGEEGSPEADAALAAVKELAAPYDHYVFPSGDPYDSDSLMQEMTVILAIAAAVIVAVLLFTSKSYLEVLVFLIVFVVSAILNMGTNFLFDSVSFITNAIAVVLQLALAIDYAIIFCHRYMEERDNGLDAREADIAALSKAIVEISSSSLTTISGLVALMLMQFRIGFDMGIVLSKGIVCSMLSVFLLMPGLLMLFNRGIEKTRHKNLVPSIAGWGRLIMKLRFVLPAVFAVCVIGGIYCSNQCDYVFSTNSTNSGNRPETRIAMDKINETFGYTNTIAVLVPRGDYDSEGAVLRRVEALDNVTTATGLANIEVEDGRYLTDKLTPRQFAELAGVDIELARLLYQAYGLSVEEYGAIFQDTDDYSVPLLDVFQFLLEQKDKGVIRLSGEQASQVEELAGYPGRRTPAAPRGTVDPDGLYCRSPRGGGGDLCPPGPDPRHCRGILRRRCGAGGQFHQRPGSGRLLHRGQPENQCAHRALCGGHPAVYLQVRWAAHPAGAHHPGLHLDQLLLPLPDGHQPVFYELPDCQRHTDGRYH